MNVFFKESFYLHLRSGRRKLPYRCVLPMLLVDQYDYKNILIIVHLFLQWSHYIDLNIHLVSVEHIMSMISATGFDIPPEEYFYRYILSSHGFLIKRGKYNIAYYKKFSLLFEMRKKSFKTAGHLNDFI